MQWEVKEGFKEESGHGLTYILKGTSDVKNKSGGDRVTAGIRQAAVKQSTGGWC